MKHKEIELVVGTKVQLKDVYGPVKITALHPRHYYDDEYELTGLNRKGHTIYFNQEDIDEIL